MTRSNPPAPSTAGREPGTGGGSIFFELERFEHRDGMRLELSGRWFGIRGRRFVRPTLTLVCGSDRIRALADLEHKPWAPDEGEPWQAAFAWEGDGAVSEAELAVAPDLAVILPGPAGRLASPKRLAPLPREEPVSLRLGTPAPAARSDAPSEPAMVLREAPREETEDSRTENEAPRVESAPESAPTRDELQSLREEVDVLRAEVEARDAERARLIAQRGEARAERDRARAERERVGSERDGEHLEHRRLRVELERVHAQRDAALAARDGALMERDGARARQNAALAERDRLTTERDDAVRQRNEIAAKREQAMSAHAAGLVMRESVRSAALEHPRQAHWLQRFLAVALMLAVLAALGLVLHVL